MDKQVYLDPKTGGLIRVYHNPEGSLTIMGTSKGLLNLCPEHAARFSPNEIREITGRQSCDICKERG